jgi:PAS domain S-box-containing protein
VKGATSLLWLQHELLQHVRFRSSVHETLAHVVPLLVRRLRARAAYAFSGSLPSDETLAFCYPRSDGATPALLEAIAQAAASGAPVPFGAARSVHAWSLPQYGLLALVRHGEPMAAPVGKALVPVFEALGQTCAAQEALERSRDEVRRLAQTNELLQTLVDSVPEALVVTDELGRLVFVNQPWSVFSGEAPERAVGQPLNRYVGRGPGSELTVAAIDDVARGLRQGCHLVAVPWRSAGGPPLRVTVSLETIRSHSGRVRGAMGSVRSADERTAELVLGGVRAARATASPVATAAPATVGPLALVVEDDPASTIVLREMLRVLGWRSVEVADGRDALPALEANAPDLVLMDVNMPLVDGLEATRAIRRFEAERGRPPLPIVAVTAHTMKDDRATFLAAGMSDYVPKPVSLETLRQVLAAQASRRD